MRIVKPGYQIQDRIFLTQEERVEEFGRIAYKSEHLITNGSAAVFVGNMISLGHKPVLEGCVYHLRIMGSENFFRFFLENTNTKYLAYEYHSGVMYISGTARAFRDAIFPANGEIHREIAGALFASSHVLFPEWVKAPEPKRTWLISAGEVVDSCAFPEDHIMKCVKFTVNRAISHEIVRHRPCSFLQESQRYCRYNQDKFGNEVTFIDPMFFKPGTIEHNLWLQSMFDAEETYLELLKTSSPQAARTVLPNSCKTELNVFATATAWKHILKLRTSPEAEPSMREVMIPLANDLFTHSFE